MASEWNVETLKEDIQKYTTRREELLTTIKKMEEAKVRADETLRKIPDEENVWKERCLQKQEENNKLQRDLNELVTPRHQGEVDSEKKASESGTTLETMSDLALKQVQRKLEKDKTEVEWKLKEYGWRLDQAAAALSRAEEEKKAILTQIGHAVIKLKDIKKGGEITKSFSTH